MRLGCFTRHTHHRASQPAFHCQPPPFRPCFPSSLPSTRPLLPVGIAPTPPSLPPPFRAHLHRVQPVVLSSAAPLSSSRSSLSRLARLTPFSCRNAHSLTLRSNSSRSLNAFNCRHPRLSSSCGCHLILFAEKKFACPRPPSRPTPRPQWEPRGLATRPADRRPLRVRCDVCLTLCNIRTSIVLTPLLSAVKVSYTFDDASRSQCLARWPHLVSTPVVQVDPDLLVGAVELKTCILSIISARSVMLPRMSPSYNGFNRGMCRLCIVPN